MKQLSQPEITALAQKYPNIVGYGLGSEAWPLNEIAWIAGEDEHNWQRLDDAARKQPGSVRFILSELRRMRKAIDAVEYTSKWLQRLAPQLAQFATVFGEFAKAFHAALDYTPGYHYPPRPRNGYNMSTRRKGTN